MKPLHFLRCLVIAGPGLMATQVSAQCEELKLQGPATSDQYAYSVSWSADRMAIGLPGGGGPGSVYVYEKIDGSWSQVALLQASDAVPGQDEEFGYSVAIEDDTLLVGAIYHGWLSSEGTAYVFERQTDGTWVETAQLLPPESDTFGMGWAVQLEGDRAVVGAPGASIGSTNGKVFVYERVAGVWTKKNTLKPTIALGRDSFGAALDLEGDRVAIGASYMFGNEEGLAFVFKRNPLGTQWSQEAVFSPSDLSDWDSFGKDVAFDGDTVLVSAPLHDLVGWNAGAVYEFKLGETGWSLTDKFWSDDLVYNRFGWSLDLVSDRAVIGASYDYGVAPAGGAAYVFEREAGGWTQTAKFFGSDPLEGDSFGFAVDMEGSEVLIGAPNVVSGLVSPGYAYAFTLEPKAGLVADTGAVSVSQGGSQVLELDACAGHAGDLYLLAGTLSGTVPGSSFAGFSVPLNPDAYFLHTVNHPSSLPLSASFGTLDAFGRATASFSLPPGSAPSLTGLVLHHAYGVLDAATIQLEAVSTAVPLTLAP